MPGNRKSSRLKDYDYTQQGAYYVTVCAPEHASRDASRSAPTAWCRTIGHTFLPYISIRFLGNFHIFVFA